MRKRRRLVYAPAAVGALALAATAAAWLVLRARVAEALDAAPGQARAAGVELSLGAVRVGGFPLRLRVASGPVRIAGGAGWRLEAPALVAQAYVFAPGHWVVVAPEGLTVTRPQGGPVVVAGRALRASVAGVDRSPWRVALVGDDVTFATPPGAHAFSLAGAGRVGLYLKPAGPPPRGDGAVLLELSRARATPGGPAARLAADAPFDAAAEGRLTALAAFQGRGWGEALRRWRDAGGALRLGHVEALGDASELRAEGGVLGVDAQGRLAGAVPLRLSARRPPPAAGGRTPPRPPAGAPLDLVLRDGEVRLGPARVGAAPGIG